MNVTVRKAEIKDAEAIAGLIRDVGWFPAFERNCDTDPDDGVRKHLEICMSGDSHSIYVVEGDDGSLAGYAAVHWLPYLFLKGPEGFISELFVRSDLRGKRK